MISFLLLCLYMLTACSSKSEVATQAEKKEIKNEVSQIVSSEEDYSYEDILSGKIGFETESGVVNIDDIDFMSDKLYKYIDVDSDGEDELCIKGRIDLYVIKECDGVFKEIYRGCGYDNPINTSDYQGIFYYRPGGAPDNQVYMFTEISSGEVKEKVYAAWYDTNENGDMDGDDWYFLDEEEEKSVSKEEWLNIADDFIKMKDMEIEWDEI